MKYALAWLPLCFFLAACATSSGRPSPELSGEELNDFEARLRGTVMAELREKRMPAVIRELNITHSRRLSNGNIKLAYHLVFDTNDTNSGQVTHSLDSEATIEREVFQLSDLEQAVVWKLIDTTPPTQGLEFHDAIVIEAKPK